MGCFRGAVKGGSSWGWSMTRCDALLDGDGSRVIFLICDDETEAVTRSQWAESWPVSFHIVLQHASHRHLERILATSRRVFGYSQASKISAEIAPRLRRPGERKARGIYILKSIFT